MDEAITDQELRRRLLAFNAVVPPVTSSTRKLLMKKLVNLESGRAVENDASKSMPPPQPKTKDPTNGTNDSIIISSSSGGKQSQYMKFDNTDNSSKITRRRRLYRAPDPLDTSDSEVDTGSKGLSILPTNPYIASSSPKSIDRSLMNVSDWKSTVTTDDQIPYVSSPETRKSPSRQYEKQTNKIIPGYIDSKSNKTPTQSVNQKLRSSSISKTQSHADQTIQKWKEKLMNQSQNQNVAYTPLFNSPSPIPKISSQRKNIHFAQKYQGNLFKKNSQNIYFLVLFIGFFGIIFGLYFTSIQSSTVVLPTGILNSLCAKKNLQGSHCDAEQEKVQRLYNSLVSQVQDKYIKNQCDKSYIEPTIDTQTEFEYISTHENMPPREIEELVELFKSIAKTYADSPIGFDTSFKINIQPNLPIICAVKQIFSNMFYLTLWLGIVALSVVGLYFIICYITTKGEKHKQEVNQLIENTIDLLKEQAQNRPNENYLPIIHLRDSLIPFNERQSKSKIWAEVVQYFTESESCVRSEIQEIDGEDFEVWRWVQPMSPGI